MDPTDITPLLDQIDDVADQLEESVKPLQDVQDLASKLALLDKAKLYMTMAYSIESLIYSSLRLSGVDAKEHPVMKEILRVRQYFAKIQAIENPPKKPEQSLNKEAAIRFIRSDLAENQDKEMNAKLSAQIAQEKERAMAKRKADEASPSEQPNPEEHKSKKSKKPKKTKSSN